MPEGLDLFLFLCLNKKLKGWIKGANTRLITAPSTAVNAPKQPEKRGFNYFWVLGVIGLISLYSLRCCVISVSLPCERRAMFMVNMWL